MTPLQVIGLYYPPSKVTPNKRPQGSKSKENWKVILVKRTVYIILFRLKNQYALTSDVLKKLAKRN